MLTYTMNEKNKIPLYEQLYRNIKTDIINGKIKSGEKLPSKRVLCTHLGISKVTVEHAYAQLADEGYIYSVEKSGYFAEKVFSPSDFTHTEIYYDDEKPHKYKCDISSGSINPDLFPFTVWSRLMRSVMLDFRDELVRKTQSGGAYILRRAICEYLLDFRGMNVLPEQIIIGAGTEYFYSILVQYFGIQNHYAVEDPGYEKIANVYRSNGAEVTYISMDDDGIVPQELERCDANILHISPSHHFPTGIVTSISRRRKILEWAREKTGRFIIEDDYDSEFRFSGRPLPTLQSMDGGENVIYMNSFTKTMCPSMRISYMVLPRCIAKDFIIATKMYSCPVPTFEQYTLASFISEGYFEKHINRTKKHYRRLRDTLIDELKIQFGDNIRICGENSGLHFLLELKTALSDDDIKERLLRCDVKVKCLSDYFHNRENRTGTLVVSYSGINENIIKDICRILAECII